MPDLDPGAWARGLIDALMAAYPALIEAASNAMAAVLKLRLDDLTQRIQSTVLTSDFNFVTRTPPTLSYNLGGVTDMYTEWRKATIGLVTISVVVGALALLGRQTFGWKWPIPDNFGRIILGIVLVSSMPFIYATTIGMANGISDAISDADLPGIEDAGLDPLTTGVMVLIWVILGIRLLVRMAYRLIYLVVLLAVGPLAAFCLFVPGAEGYWRMWVGDYVGLLVGQVMVVICLKLSVAIIGAGIGGSIGGLCISVGVLMLAYDLCTIGADIKGGGLSNVIKQTAATVALFF